MSVTLVSRKGYWKSFSHLFWDQILKLARNFGWTPAGTCCPRWVEEDPLMASERHEWSGTYSTNDQQEVLTSDAKAFVVALELALREIPDCDKATFLAARDEARHAIKEQLAVFQAEAFAKGENIIGRVQRNPDGTSIVSLSPAEVQNVKLRINPPVPKEVYLKLFSGWTKTSIADLVGFVHEAINEPFDDGRAFKIS